MSTPITTAVDRKGGEVKEQKRDDEGDDEVEGLEERKDLQAGRETFPVPIGAEVEARVTTIAEPTLDVKQMMAVLNGDYYMPNDMGESETVNVGYHWMFPAGFKGVGETGQYSENVTTEAMMRQFMGLNFQKLKSLSVSDALAAKITMWRAIAVRHGLVNFRDTPALTSTRYVEVEVAAVGDAKGYNAYIDALKAIPDKVRDNIAGCFANVVCTIAFVFRVRGHHYLDDLKEVYTRIWRKVRGMPEGMIVDGDWQTIATVGLHAITPIRLDKFWVTQAKAGRISNPLIIRLDAPAAGTAAWFAIYAGISNLQALVPEHSERFSRQIALVEEAIGFFKRNRWAGSINRRLYLAKETTFSLTAVAELAAAVKGSVEPDELASELKNAASLDKVTSNAPLVRVLYRTYADGMLSATAQPEVRAKLGQQLFKFIGFKGEVDGSGSE